MLSTKFGPSPAVDWDLSWVLFESQGEMKKRNEVTYTCYTENSWLQVGGKLRYSWLHVTGKDLKPEEYYLQWISVGEMNPEYT